MKIKHLFTAGILLVYSLNANPQGFGLGTNTPSQILHLKKSGDVAVRFESAAAGSQVTVGPSNPGTNANDASTGTVAWGTTANAVSSDNAYATAVAGTSQYLKATNFGFAIPAGAAIDGIKVEIEKSKVVPAVVSLLAGSWTTSIGAYSFAVGAGSNRLLILVAGMEHNASANLTSVTYGGVAMTQAGEIEIGSAGYYARNEIWYLNETGIAAAVGTAFAFTWSVAPGQVLYTAAAFANVDQTTPIGNTSTNSSTVTDPLPISSGAGIAVSAGDMVVTGVTNGQPVPGSYLPPAGYTEGSDFAASSSLMEREFGNEINNKYLII